MCIVSNWVNEARDFFTVTKYDDLPNSLLPNFYVFEILYFMVEETKKI